MNIGSATIEPVQADVHLDGSPIRLLLVGSGAELADPLRLTGYEVMTAQIGSMALRADRFDLVVLDMELPDMPGSEVCRRLRDSGWQGPVVFLGDRNDPAALRAAFGNGADDYLVKPFQLEELTLRLKALLRRCLGYGRRDTRLTVGDLVMAVESERVWRGGCPVSLSPTEFRLLHYLMVNRNRVLPKRQILAKVWNHATSDDTSLVETYIFYLRRKIDKDGPKLIHTVRGLGYVLRDSRQ